MVRFSHVVALVFATLLIAAFDASARTPTAEDMLNLRELGDYRGGLTVSPDGAHLAVFERETRLQENDYRYSLIVLPSAGGQARVVADAGGIILRHGRWGPSGASIDRPPVWSPDSSRLAYFAMRDGQIELWCVSVYGGPPEQIVSGPGDVLRFAWLDSSHLIVETATPRATLAQISARQTRLGFHPDDHFTPYSGLRPAPYPGLAPRQVVINIWDRRDRAATVSEREALDNAQRPAGAIASDQAQGVHAWIAPRTPNDPAMTPSLGLYQTGIGGSAPRMCRRRECTDHMLDAWVFGHRILFRRMEGWNDGLTALYEWDAAQDAVRLVRRENEELFSCRRAGQLLACLQEAPQQPRRIVLINPATGSLSPLYDPNSQWTQFTRPRVERIEVNDAYGNQSFAHLVFPPDYTAGRRYPLVIVQYRSRGFLRGGTGNEYPIYPLAGRGYLVLSVDRPEWRGSEAQLPYAELSTRTELDNSENQMKQSALEAMLRSLDDRGLIDTRRVGVTGMSDGAETVYWAITRSNLFAAAVVSTPPADPADWTMGAPALREERRVEGNEGPWMDVSSPWGQWWARNTTVQHAESIHTPLLMNLPEAEALVGFPLATRLGELHRPVDLYLYPGAYHVKWRPAQLLATQNRSMDWLDFWLRGIEHDDPQDPGRLMRWRNLREDASRR